MCLNVDSSLSVYPVQSVVLQGVHVLLCMRNLFIILRVRWLGG